MQRGMQQQVVMRRAGIARIYVTRGTFVVDALFSAAWFAQVGGGLSALANVLCLLCSCVCKRGRRQLMAVSASTAGVSGLLSGRRPYPG